MDFINKALEDGKTILSEHESKLFLQSYGIPVTREKEASNKEVLLEAISEIGFPLVLKGCGSDLSHKTERNLVHLDIRSRDEALGAFDVIYGEVEKEGGAVLVQEMVKGTRELVMGLTRDRQFGPCVMFGLGGIFTEILKDIKPANCWEENYNIDDLNSVQTTINNKRYSQYKIYQATYYPLNTEDISIPSVPFKMIKYKVAKNPSFFGRNRQEDFKTFYSKPRVVRVVELPPHPLMNVVSVGNYSLEEELSSTNLQTGNSFTYNFKIIGEGNISAIEKPNLVSDAFFEFYPPNIRQDVNRGNNRVTGSKAFSYYIIPNEPGSFELGEYFQWIYFNTTKDDVSEFASR